MSVASLILGYVTLVDLNVSSKEQADGADFGGKSIDHFSSGVCGFSTTYVATRLSKILISLGVDGSQFSTLDSSYPPRVKRPYSFLFS